MGLVAFALYCSCSSSALIDRPHLLHSAFSFHYFLTSVSDRIAARRMAGAALAACGGIRVGVDTRFELYPKRSSPQLERVGKKSFQIGTIGVGYVLQRAAVNDHERRIHPALISVAH